MSENYTSSSDKDPEIPFSDDEVVRDDELILDEDKPGASPEEKQARAERRRERARTRERERKEQAEELKALKERDAQRERELAEMRGALTRQSQPAATTPGKDPYQERLDAIYERQSNALAAVQAEVKAGTFNDERANYYDRQAREIEAEKLSVYTERALAQREARAEPLRRQEQAQQIWVQKYPDIYQNPQAFQYAQATFQRRQALGERATNEMVDEVMREAMTQFKLGPKQAPSATERARLSGVSASGGGGAGNSSPGVQMTREFKKMAEALYSDLPPEKAHQKWVNEVGKPLRARKVL